jgi:hypothetical protein
MKAHLLDCLKAFESDLRKLRKDVSNVPGDRVAQNELRQSAERLATLWVEELRSPLEHKFKINPETIRDTSEGMKRLHILSRPNNRKSSYLDVLDEILNRFKDKFVLPIQQTSTNIETVFDLEKLVKGLKSEDESNYLQEAIDCANDRHARAAIVLGWCALVDRIQKKVQSIGFAKFNVVSTQLKQQTSGRHKRWNKEFSITTLGELQEVFDTDLITVCEGLGLFDSNQADRLIRVDFQYRNHSAHPGQAPIEDAHLIAFFTDINDIVLLNPKFSV